jgi:general L-amino acid transport system substrate-binding protein
MRKLAIVALVLVLVGGATAAFANRLDDIKARGTLVCGVNDKLPGFGSVNAQGEFEGFDVDFCKAIAAGILGDASAVEYRPLSAQERFTAVQSGEVDVLIRNTTWTSSRDTSVGLEFTATTFYDGQGFMTRKDSGINTLQDLEGRKICVQSGTTTELNLNGVLSALNISFTPVIFENADQLTAAYDQGACDAWTTDKSGLASRLITLRDPSAQKILDATISKEPLGPSVLDGESELYDAVQWVVFGLFTAEEYGITSQNVQDIAASTQNPTVKRMLNNDGDNLTNIGLRADGILQAIAQVGNYAEIYTRNLGPDTPFDIPRGLNKLYTEGGLLFAPPFR